MLLRDLTLGPLRPLLDSLVLLVAPIYNSAALLSAWRPYLFVDLHTTNGSYHGYALTWSPGLNPNATRANTWVRDSLSRKEALPEAYLIPTRLGRVIELLRPQGIAVEPEEGMAAGRLERFLVDGVRRGPLFEGHHPTLVDGRWAPFARGSGSGWYLVRTAQPLGLLAAYLLEPASEDGVVTWNLLDGELAPGRASPILRSRTAAATAAQPEGASDDQHR